MTIRAGGASSPDATSRRRGTGRRWVLCLAIVGCLVLTGCAGIVDDVGDGGNSDQVDGAPGGNVTLPASDQGTERTDRPTRRATGAEGPPNDVQLWRRAGETPTVSGGTFSYDGRVVASLSRLDPERTFDDVTLCLYDDDWSVIAAEPIGSIPPGESAHPVEIRTDTVPTRIVVEHPDFREQAVFNGVLIRRDGEYVLGNRTDLDRTPPSTPGECR